MKYLNVSQQGYTLLEMMLVMALTAVMALSGGLAWRHHQHRVQLDQAARQVADFLQRVQRQAAWGNHHYRITVQSGLGWSLAVAADPRGTPRPAVTWRIASPAGDIRLDISAPGYLTLAGLRNTATPAHLTLSNPAGRIRLILSGKGRIRVCSERGRWAGITAC